MHRKQLCDLAERELESVYRLAHHLSGASDVRAEYLVEETYALALQLPAYVPLDEKAVRLWLFSVLNAVLLAQVAGNDAEEWIEERHLQASPIAAAKILSWYKLSENDWDHVDARLKQAFDELPLRYRIIFLLWSSEGLSIRQIASVVHVDEPTVRARLLRATMVLATQLGEIATSWLTDCEVDAVAQV